MLRAKPPGEDSVGPNNRYVPGLAKSNPPGEDGIDRAGSGGESGEELENAAAQMAAHPDGVDDDGQGEPEIDFLQLVPGQPPRLVAVAARLPQRALRRLEVHRPDWRGRSKLFVPKTRAAVRKDNAAVAASLFNSIDAINCLPGNESDPKQRAAAALMEELVNYRTDRVPPAKRVPLVPGRDGRAPGCRAHRRLLHQAVLEAGFRKTGECPKRTAPRQRAGASGEVRDVYELDVDRPDMR
jgi:hypothetical protein